MGRLIVEATTSSNDLAYFLLVWNVATILQHFLFCKWQGIQECLHRRNISRYADVIAVCPENWKLDLV